MPAIPTISIAAPVAFVDHSPGSAVSSTARMKFSPMMIASMPWSLITATIRVSPNGRVGAWLTIFV